MTLPIPRVDLQVGTRAWAERTVEWVKHLWQSKQNTHERWVAAVEELREGRAWEALGKTNLDELLESVIGLTVEESHELLDQGRPKKEKQKGNNVTFSVRGNRPAYILARLKRDASASTPPDTEIPYAELLRQVNAGEISAHQAAIRANYLTPKTPLEQLHHWWKKATLEERLEFLRGCRHDVD